MKYCFGCEKDLGLSEFHKHKGRKLGVTELCKPCRNTKMVEKRHGLESGGLKRLLEGQDYKCAICENVDNLAVDHCHSSGKIRGMLCNNCNNGIGRFKDNINSLQNAIKYLMENI